jgi:lipid-A-disaccharide synthase
MQGPMVIMYKMNAFSAWLAKRLVKSTPFFGMVNLVMGREVVTERFQEQASSEELVLQLEKFIKSPQLRFEVRTDLGGLKHLLGDSGATSRVAHILEDYF